MLIVRFRLGERALGIRASDVREVLPVARFRPIPLAPAWVAGDILLHGAPCPVLDLRRWLDDAPTRIDLATRLLRIDWAGGADRPLAVLAERVRDAVEVDADAIVAPAVGRPGDRVLGGEVVVDGEIVTILDPAQLLTTELATVLYARDAA